MSSIPITPDNKQTSKKVSVEIFDGMTSIGLPGKVGNRGERSRVFFYGNSSFHEPESYAKIYINDSSIGISSPYAIIVENFTPEIYDYIMYTDKNTDYLFIIESVSPFNTQDYKVNVELLDQIDFTNTLNDSELNYDEINFVINWVPQKWTKTIRNYKKYETLQTEGLGFRSIASPDIIFNTQHPNCLPIYRYRLSPSTSVKTSADMIDFSIVCPSNSNFLLNDQIKITIEFYTLQASFMDTCLQDKFTRPSGSQQLRENYIYTEKELIERENCTYRGIITKYDTYNTHFMNFDDEHLEVFSIIIKDFDEGNGEDNLGKRTFTKTISLPVAALKRCVDAEKVYTSLHNDAKIFAYIKDGFFIRKIYIGNFDIQNVINNIAKYNQISETETEVVIK